jgi:hypothetical protein
MTIAQAVSLFSLCIPAALAGSLKGGVSVEKEGLVNKAGGRSLLGKGGKGGGSAGASNAVTLTFTTNQRYHHFGNWFFMVHDPAVVPPIFTPGGVPIFELNAICEFGDPAPIAELFGNLEAGVASAEPVLAVLFGSAWATTAVDVSDPLFGINTLDISVEVPEDHVVTAIAMIANSNDGCIFLNGADVLNGETHEMIEVDVGTELNAETCETIGGCLTFGLLEGAMEGSSLCPCATRGNEAVEVAGEGFMARHTGVGVRNNNLFLDLDWRTPMVSVTASVSSEVTTSVS